MKSNSSMLDSSAAVNETFNSVSTHTSRENTLNGKELLPCKLDEKVKLKNGSANSETLKNTFNNMLNKDEEITEQDEHFKKERLKKQRHDSDSKTIQTENSSDQRIDANSMYSSNLVSTKFKATSKEESDVDIYDGLDDEILDTVSNSEEDMNWGMGISMDDQLLEDDDQGLCLAMSPSPKSIKSTNTDNIDDSFDDDDSQNEHEQFLENSNDQSKISKDIAIFECDNVKLAKLSSTIEESSPVKDLISTSDDENCDRKNIVETENSKLNADISNNEPLTLEDRESTRDEDANSSSSKTCDISEQSATSSPTHKDIDDNSELCSAATSNSKPEEADGNSELCSAETSSSTDEDVDGNSEMCSAETSSSTDEDVVGNSEICSAETSSPTDKDADANSEVHSAIRSNPTPEEVDDSTEVRSAIRSSPTPEEVDDNSEVCSAIRSSPTPEEVDDNSEVRSAIRSSPTPEEVDDSTEVRSAIRSSPTPEEVDDNSVLRSALLSSKTHEDDDNSKSHSAVTLTPLLTNKDVDGSSELCSAATSDSKENVKDNHDTEAKENSNIQNVAKKLLDGIVSYIGESMDHKTEDVFTKAGEKSKKRSLSHESSCDFQEVKKFKSSLENLSSKFTNGSQEANAKLKNSESSCKYNIEDKISTQNRNLFQLLNESKIKFDKIDTAKLNSSSSCEKKSENDEIDIKKGKDANETVMDSQAVIKEEEKETPMDISEEDKPKVTEQIIKKGKKLKLKVTPDELEEMIMVRLKKLVNEQLAVKYEILNKRCLYLEAELKSEKAQSLELQREVTQLNVALSKAANELQNMNGQKVSQRTVGLQVRFSSERSLSKPDANGTVPNKNQVISNPNVVTKQGQRVPCMTNGTLPSGNAKGLLSAERSSLLAKSQSSSNDNSLQGKVYTSKNKVGIVEPRSQTINSLLKGATVTTTAASESITSRPSMLISQLTAPKITSSSKTQVLSSPVPVTLVANNNMAQVTSTVKSPSAQTSIVNIIDLTADEDEGKNNASKAANALPKKHGTSVGSTILVPSTTLVNSSVRTVTAGRPISQPGQLIHNSSGQLILAPQQAVGIPPGQQIVLTPNINTATGGTFFIKTNNLIPTGSNLSSVPPQSSIPTTSVVVSTVRLPSAVERLASIPGTKTSNAIIHPRPAAIINKNSTIPNARPSAAATNSFISLASKPRTPLILVHPAPLPKLAIQGSYKDSGIVKLIPPQPVLRTSRVSNGIVLSWSMDLSPSHAEISSYMLFAYQESSARPSTSMWKKVGDVKALPLPMACTLTQFMEGHQYHFAVCAMDIYKRFGPFSKPGSILLTPKSTK